MAKSSFQGSTPAASPTREQVRAEGGGDVPSDGVTLVPVNAPLALLQVDRVVGQVPMDDGVAPEMEVQPLLPDRCGGEDEGPERGVECPGDGFDPGLAALVEGLSAEGDREASSHPVPVELDVAIIPLSAGDVHPKRGCAQFQGLSHFACDFVGCFQAPVVVGQSQITEPVTEHMAMLVENGLEVAVDRVSQNITPVEASTLVGV